MFVECLLALAAGEVDLDLLAANGNAPYLLDGRLSADDVLEEHQSLPALAVDARLCHWPELIELHRQIFLTNILSDTVHPHTRGRHRLAKPQLNPIIPEMLPVHGPDGLNDTNDIRILTKRITTHRPLFLNVYFNDFTKLIEMFSEI